MANAITTQTIADNDRNLIYKMQISGDNSGDETDTLVVDMSTFNADSLGRSPTSLKIKKIESSLAGFSVQLLWDATANVTIWDMPDGDSTADFCSIGGLNNNAGTGVTGDILFSTSGLASKDGAFILHLAKQY